MLFLECLPYTIGEEAWSASTAVTLSLSLGLLSKKNGIKKKQTLI